MTDKKPSTFRIDATEAQCAYLNKLSETNMYYRRALKEAVKMCQKELDGGYWGLSHQTLNEIQKYSGALDTLRQIQWIAFSDLPVVKGEGVEKMKSELALDERRDQIKEWVKLALEENPDGMSGLNWFFPEEKA